MRTWLGLHPFLALLELAIFAALCTLDLVHAPALVIIAKNLVVFAGFYFLADRMRAFWTPLANTRGSRSELAFSAIAWLISSGYELLAYRYATFAPAPWWVVGLLIAWVDLHFYVTHRLLHTRWLMRHVHSVHHRSVTPNPWSSLSFHPAEALVYFSSLLIVFVVPVSVPQFLFVKIAVDLTPAWGHSSVSSPWSGSAFHYAHHRRSKVNYGASRLWDAVFGTLQVK